MSRKDWCSSGAYPAHTSPRVECTSRPFSQFFTVPVTPIITFWVRGVSVWAFGLSYAVYNLPTDIAVKLAVATTIGTAVMWPFNAKFGYFEKLPVIYPKHYEPEILLSALILAGLYTLSGM